MGTGAVEYSTVNLNVVQLSGGVSTASEVDFGVTYVKDHQRADEHSTIPLTAVDNRKNLYRCQVGEVTTTHN